MKRYLAYLCVLVAVVLPTMLSAKKLNIVVSSSIAADLVKQVTGNTEHNITTLVGPENDPHVFQPSPSNAVAIAKADLIVDMGLGFEPWMADLAKKDRIRGQYVSLSDAVSPEKLLKAGETWTLAKASAGTLACCVTEPVEEKACCAVEAVPATAEKPSCCVVTSPECCADQAKTKPACCAELKKCCEGTQHEKGGCCQAESAGAKSVGTEKGAVCPLGESTTCPVMREQCCTEKLEKKADCCVVSADAQKDCCAVKEASCCESAEREHYKDKGLEKAKGECCLAKNETTCPKTAESCDACPVRGEKAHGGHSHDHDDYDPHVWLDVQNVLPMINLIRHHLEELDSGNADTYSANATRYLESLWSLDEEIIATMAEIPENRRAIITEHNSFAYFAKRYGLIIKADLLNSLSTETAEPSAAHVVKVVSLLRETQPNAIFRDSSSGSRLVDRVAKEAGAQIVDVRSGYLGHAGSGYDSYLSLMRYNLSQIHATLRP